jgi:hypothetical protein
MFDLKSKRLGIETLCQVCNAMFAMRLLGAECRILKSTTLVVAAIMLLQLVLVQAVQLAPKSGLLRVLYVGSNMPTLFVGQQAVAV